MGHKWMWNAALGGLPPESFLAKVDPLLAGVRAKLEGEYATSDKIAGTLAPQWAEKLGLRAGIPIPGGRLRCALGCDRRRARKQGDVVNVVGTSTCIIAYAPKAQLIPGVCGVVPGSVHPQFTGIEAGLSATGDIFSAIARRANTSVEELSKGLASYRAGQTGLLRMTWDNGDRTVLVNPNLGGMTLGWNLLHTGAGRTVRRHRRNGISHPRDSRSHERIRRAHAARHQRRRHSAKQSRAEPGVCECAWGVRCWFRAAR